MSEDYTQDFDTPAVIAPDAIQRLVASAEEVQKIEAFIAETEANLAVAKGVLQTIKTKQMPDIMMELQTSDWTHNGVRYQLTDFISGSLPKDEEKRAEAFRLLIDEYDASGIITTKVETVFSREEYDAAKALYQAITADGYTATLDTGVHAQTLFKFARERIESGEPIDLDALGLYTGKVVKYKEVKTKKGGA